jgi:hypothetical protein
MAARKPAEKIQPQEYAEPGSWEVGKEAPADAYRALGDDYMTPTGPVVHEHPGGYARQIVAKGGVVTEGVKRELAEAADEEKTDKADSTSDESAGA